MIKACNKNDHKMVLSFISHGFDLDCPSLLSSEDIIEEFKIFSARASTAYAIAKFHHNQKNLDCDPISDAFFVANKAMREKVKHVEHQTKLLKIEDQSKKFLVDMLDKCNGVEEAETLLAKDMDLCPYFGQDYTKSTPFPILEIAIADRHTEFVGHDYCQQLLLNNLLTSRVTGEFINWSSPNSKICHVMKSILLLSLIHI